MSVEFRPIPLEVQLEQKLEVYRDDLASLRYQIANQRRDEQLTAFDAGEYYEDQLPSQRSL